MHTYIHACIHTYIHPHTHTHIMQILAAFILAYQTGAIDRAAASQGFLISAIVGIVVSIWSIASKMQILLLLDLSSSSLLLMRHVTLYIHTVLTHLCFQPIVMQSLSEGFLPIFMEGKCSCSTSLCMNTPFWCLQHMCTVLNFSTLDTKHFRNMRAHFFARQCIVLALNSYPW